MSTKISIFKGKEKETAYMAAYDEAMKLWPVPCETTVVCKNQIELLIIERERLFLFDR